MISFIMAIFLLSMSTAGAEATRLQISPGIENRISFVPNARGKAFPGTKFSSTIYLNGVRTSLVPIRIEWEVCHYGLDRPGQYCEVTEAPNYKYVQGTYPSQISSIQAFSYLSTPNGLEKVISSAVILDPGDSSVGDVPQIWGEKTVGSVLSTEFPALWYLCFYGASEPSDRLQDSSCQLTSPVESKEFVLQPRHLGWYVIANIIGSSSVFTASTVRITKAIQTIHAYSPESKNIGGTAKIEIVVEGRSERCPTKIFVNAKDALTAQTRKFAIKLKNCEGFFSRKILSNTHLKFTVPGDPYFLPATEESEILATPSLNARAPIRTFGKFRVSVSSRQPLNITCNATEDYYTFDGNKFASSAFKVKLSYGSGSALRKPLYVGVIKGFLYCPASKKYGDSYESYKVFSY